LNECLVKIIEKEPARYNTAAKINRRSKATAGVFFTEAVRLYKKCSAERKAVLLIEKYPEYFEEETPERLPGTPAPMTVLSNIDINYLTKSCLIIPAEMEEKTIIHKIMNVVLESSGAQHGYLIMEEGGDLIIRAESHITERDIVKTTNQNFENSKDICHAIIRYVHRTKEIVLLENATEKGEFKDNPEVQNLKLKSVLCLPVIKQHKLLGILYLENRLSDSVFTPERTDMTKLFTLEAAISIENARLVENMKQAEAALKRHREHLEEMVEERTRQLSKVQEDLLIAERLAVLGQLAGSISHEIRNPLNVISSSAYYIKMKLGTTDKKLREHIDHIEAEVKNSTAIIDSILSLSGIKEPHKVRLELIAALNEALVTSEIPHSVKILRQIPESEIFVVADKEQLFMAFHNILKNALQAMGDQGTLTIKIEKEANTKVKISFIDSGVGIPPENINKLFQPLFTTKVRGIGFGLLICKMIIEKHGGTIEIKSESGKGTAVTITLRIA
jgi:signal transduction histidine kinase